MTDEAALAAAESKVEDLLQAFADYDRPGPASPGDVERYHERRQEMVAIVATVLKLEAA
jgi:hypothetical protein